MRQRVQLRFRFFEAGRADAMRERGVGVLRHVDLDTLPVVPVVADAFAVGADRQQSTDA